MANNIQVTIPNDFPSLYLSEGPNFIAFVQAYYEWLQQSGNALYESQNIYSYSDIDLTLDQFLIHFQNEFMNSIPGNILVDQRLLLKHITNLYQSKGSKRGFELLFRILFNEDIKLYIPGQYIFSTSGNKWVQPTYIEVNDSPFLSQLVGKMIYSSSSGATALVEEYNVITLNNRVINILNLSNVNGTFVYGNFILSTDVTELTLKKAPMIIGSLSAVSVTQGGIFFNVGDILNISGIGGSGGLARVSSIRQENGKVIFELVDGGYGFTMNAQVQVIGGNGAGATFSVGSLIDQTVYSVNLDIINDYYNTQLDISSEGFTLNITGLSGSFQVSEVVNSSANGIALDFAYLSGNNLIVGESLSNSSLGINSLEVIFVDNPSMVNLTGPDTMLSSANLIGGIELIGNTSGDVIYINSVLLKEQYIANGTVTSANSTVINVNQVNGYFLQTSILNGQTSGATATVANTIRDTEWNFPLFSNANLDSSFSRTLLYEDLVIGTISSITGENPGNGYSSNPSVVITEPLIFELQISDGMGGVWGQDANVQAIALNANGIITSAQIIDSGYGYIPGEPLNLYSNNVSIASGIAVVDGTGIGQGYWKTNQSFLSDQIYLQDSFYYQNFSYDIFVSRMLNSYKTLVEDIMGPVGYKMFGRYRINDGQDNSANLTYSSTLQLSGNKVTYSGE